MQTFYLHIKDGTRIYFDAVVLFDVFCKTQFVLIFDIHELLLCFFIGCIDRHLLNMGKICDPVVTDMFTYPVCKKRIAMHQESTLCDSIRLVVEFLWEQLIEIVKLLVL